MVAAAEDDRYADPAQPLGTAKIGIAEEFVDEQHPDFVAQGTSAWVVEDASLSAEPASVTLPMQAYRIRDFDRTDHGTMIGGVIGARHMEFQASGGLAPRALLFHIHSSDPQIGEDIRRSFLRGVHIFNISAHFGKDKIPSSLEERIRLHPTALFVVAAGNDVVPGRDLELATACSRTGLLGGSQERARGHGNDERRIVLARSSPRIPSSPVRTGVRAPSTLPRPASGFTRQG